MLHLDRLPQTLDWTVKACYEQNIQAYYKNSLITAVKISITLSPGLHKCVNFYSSVMSAGNFRILPHVGSKLARKYMTESDKHSIL